LPDLTTPFAPIARRTVASAVRDAIEAAIRTGDMAPGSPLPSERELAEQFDVARTSIREAVQALVTVGLVEKRGNRSYVAERLPEVRFDQSDHRKRRVVELFEVRQIVEVPIARLAARNATPEQRAEIAEIAGRFHEDMALEDFRRLDRQFHWALATACGNATLAELFGKVLDSLFASEEFRTLLGSDENREAVEEIIAASSVAHRRIAGAVVAGDEEGTGGAAQDHLGHVEEQMVARLV
jgi:GntR family transcriptional regulator, transcriptional repressor for pyruvate dehydrogenase complex